MGVTTGFDVPPSFGADGEQSETQNPWADEVFAPPKAGEVADADTPAAAEKPAEAKAGDKPAFADKPVETAKDAAPKVVERPVDKSAQYVSPELAPKVDGLLASESNTVRKDFLTKLKGEKSNGERIKLIESLLNGKFDDETRREIVAPEASPEKRRILEELLRSEKEIDTRYRYVREYVVKTLPDFKDYYLNGEKDQQRQSVYIALIKDDGANSAKKLKEALGLETDKGRQDKINSLLNDSGNLDRTAIVEELLKSETDARKKQLLAEILKHESNIKTFGRMMDEKPTEESIKAVADLFKDEAQAKRLQEVGKTTDAQRLRILDQMGNLSTNPQFKQQIELLKKEPKSEERVKLLTQLLSESTDGRNQGGLRQLLDIERKFNIIADLPKEETRRKELFEALDKVGKGDYESIMKAYPLCAEWLQQAVPETFVEVGYNMGMAILPGCPLKLPIEHGQPIPPRLMEMYAKEGRIKLDMELRADQLLNPAENLDNVAKLKNSVDWLYSEKALVREKQLRYEAENFVDTLKKSFGPEGVAKYGPDGIPKGWMPPENLEDIPAWRDRVLHVVNLGNRLRNYAQAMQTINGIQSADEGLEELKKLGVEFEFGKNNQLTKFNVPQLDGLDLRLAMPANGANIQGLEQWLTKHTKEVDKALDPYKEAIESSIASKDPTAFLRHGDYPFNESLHPKIGVDYDLMSQRVTKVEQKGGNIVIEGTISFQTSSWYSYNYWVGCEPVSRNMDAAEFRKLNGIADGVEPKEGEKYKIKGNDGETYSDWTFKGKNPDGTLNFNRDQTFRIEVAADKYVPAMTAMGSVQMVKATDVDRWLYGCKLDINPMKCELPQVGFWHHGVKWGKAVMDVGLTVYGGAGIVAKGATWGARAMSAGRAAVGVAGLTHQIVDTKLPKEWREGIHMASHAFILADIGLGLGLNTFKKAFGIGAAARESASLLNTIGHGAMAVDGIAIFGPIVAADIKGVIENHMGWSTQQALERALDERGTPDRLVAKEVDDKPAKFDLKEKATRESMELMVERLGDTLLTETTDAKVKERIEKLIKEGKEMMALDPKDPKRQKFVAELSKHFTAADSAVLWSHIAGQPGKFDLQFRKDAQSKVGSDTTPMTSQEKLIASALALVLQSNEKGELPETVLSRKVVIPAHKEFQNGDWVDVPASAKDVSVSRAEITGLIERLATKSEQPSLKMAASKMMWRMGKLDHNGLAGVLLEVAQKSDNRELVGMALIDSKDVSLGYLINDITHREVAVGQRGYMALSQYRSQNFALTSNDLKRDLKAVMKDGKKSVDVRALAAELLSANDLDKVQDRKTALRECEARWQREKGKDGAYAADLVKALKYQAQQEIPAQAIERKVNVIEKGVEKQVAVTLQPDDVRQEKFRALMALKEMGTVKVDGTDYKMAPELLNGNLLKCVSKDNVDLTNAVIKNLDYAKLTTQERKEVLSILGWAGSEQVVKAKVEVLNRMREIVGGDAEIAREAKPRLLDMLNPRSTVRGADDYSWVGPYPDLHAATITALASFGCQYHTEIAKTVNLSQKDFEAKLAPGEAKDLIVGKYYQFKEGESTVWHRYMGKSQDGADHRFIKQGDPTVAILVQHIKGADRIGSAKVRLAAVQAAGDLQIPGLRELMKDAIKQETDPRVARRLREVRFPEEPPLDPKSDASIDKLNEYITQVLANKQFRDLDHYGAELKKNYPLLFEKQFKAEWDAAVDGVYSGFTGPFSFGYDSLFGSKSPKEYLKDATDAVDTRYTNEFDKLVSDAKSSPDAKTRENAIMGLLFIVTTRGSGTQAATGGEGLPFRHKENMNQKAIIAFSELSEVGAKDRGAAVKWAVEKLLTQQPDLDPDFKTILLGAAVNMTKADAGQTGDQAMTKEHLAKVLYAASKATAGFPAPTDVEKYNKEVEYHRLLIYFMTQYCRDGGATELLEAIAKEHPSDKVKADAEIGVRFLRDGIRRNVSDAAKDPDRTSTASQRRDAILANLNNPEKTTEDVVRAIARAEAGYDWRKPNNAADNEIMRSAMRQAMNDQRVRVKLIASYYMLAVGNGDDIAQAAETLTTISNTPYKYGTSDRELKYYKLEADQIMSEHIKALEKAPQEIKDNRMSIIQAGKEDAAMKKDGVLAYSWQRYDANKSFATAQQELEQTLNNPNVNEMDVVKALFAARSKHAQRTLQPTEPVLDLYRKGLEHRSEKVRMAAAIALTKSSPTESDVLRSVEVFKTVTAGSGNAQVKKEAGLYLDLIARCEVFDVAGLTASSEAVSTSADRAKTVESISQMLKANDKEKVLDLTKAIFSLRSSEKLKADDPSLGVLREALSSNFYAVRIAAANRLAEQSPESNDVRKAVSHLVDVQKSNLPARFRQDAENFLKKISDASPANAAIVADIQAKADKKMGTVLDLINDVKPPSSTDLKANAEQLNDALNAAKDTADIASVDAAIRAVYSHSLVEGAFVTNSPVGSKIREAAISHPDERVRLTAAWMLSQVSGGQDDASTGYMVLSQLIERSSLNAVKLEAANILNAVETGAKHTLSQPTSSDAQLKNAKWTLEEIARQRAAAKGAPAAK